MIVLSILIVLCFASLTFIGLGSIIHQVKTDEAIDGIRKRLEKLEDCK